MRTELTIMVVSANMNSPDIPLKKVPGSGYHQLQSSVAAI